MKRIASLAVAASIILFGGCASPTPAPPAQRAQVRTSKDVLVGEWRGTDSGGKTGEIHFFADGRIVFVLGKLSIGDQPEGSPYDVTYAVDTAATPWNFDVIVRSDGVVMGTLRGLLEVIDEDTIRVGFDATSPQGVGADRPSGFQALGPESTLVLKRMSKS